MQLVTRIVIVFFVSWLSSGCGRGVSADGDGIYTDTGQRMAKDDFSAKLKNADQFLKYYQSARQLTLRGEFDRALAELQQAYQIAALKPEQAWMKLEMAKIYEVQNKYSEAIECYKEFTQKTQSEQDVALGNSKIEELNKKLTPKIGG